MIREEIKTHLSKSAIWNISMAPAPERGQKNQIHREIVLQLYNINFLNNKKDSSQANQNSSSGQDERPNPCLDLSDGVYFGSFLFYANAKNEFYQKNFKVNQV